MYQIDLDSDEEEVKTQPLSDEQCATWVRLIQKVRVSETGILDLRVSLDTKEARHWAKLVKDYSTFGVDISDYTELIKQIHDAPRKMKAMKAKVQKKKMRKHKKRTRGKSMRKN